MTLIYLDYNATTPIDPDVLEAMMPYLTDHYGNASSSHPYGHSARRAVEYAREQVAGLIGAAPPEIVFNSGGSEANNTVIKGVAEAQAERGKHIIISAVEHAAISAPCKWLEKQGYETTMIPVDGEGRVNPADVEAALRDDTILVSIMLAQNEVGTLQPIAQIAELAHARGALMHTDAAQSVGKAVVNVNTLGIDYMTIAGHKFYGPKGIGALYIREGRTLPKLIHGVSHESDRRAGTENVPYIVGLGAAAEIAGRDFHANTAQMAAARDALWERLNVGEVALRRNSPLQDVLPNTLSVGFRDVQADRLLTEISARVAASAGAACHDGVKLSDTLEAMKVPTEYGMGTLRFSTGKHSTIYEADAASIVILSAVKRMQPKRA